MFTVVVDFDSKLRSLEYEFGLSGTTNTTRAYCCIACRNLQGDQLHLPVRANIWQTSGRFEFLFPLVPGDPARGTMAFRLKGLSPPAPMLLSTGLSTSPPPRQYSRVRTNLGWGGGSKPVPAEGGTTAGDDRCAASTSSLTHKALSRLTISHRTPCAAGIDSIL